MIKRLLHILIVMIVWPASLSQAQIVPMALWDRSRPTPRLISNSYWTNWTGTTYSSNAGMSQAGFEIDTPGVLNGDLLIIVASIDNGSSTVWPNPIATGFTQIGQAYFGPDGETYSVSWKIASGEPSSYTGVYGSGIVSASSTISLIAISHASPTAPINASKISTVSTSVTPVVGSSTGVTTTVKNCLILYMMGADWVTLSGTTTFNLPTNFLALTNLGDHGNASFDWTTQQIGYKWQGTAAATGAISGSQVSGSNTGGAWTGILAIAPPP